jgi:hypothetical protein
VKRLFPPLRREAREAFLRTALTFITVRDPFERLFSAYNDKLTTEYRKNREKFNSTLLLQICPYFVPYFVFVLMINGLLPLQSSTHWPTFGKIQQKIREAFCKDPTSNKN